MQEILQPDGDAGKTVLHNSEDAYKRYDVSNNERRLPLVKRDPNCLNSNCMHVLFCF